MPSNYLKKYNDAYNPVNERLELKNKLIVRSIILIVTSLAFVILRLLNVHNVFSDISSGLGTIIYVIMGISLAISFFSFCVILFSLISPKASKAVFEKIPFNTKKVIFTILDWIIYIPLCICIALYIYSFAFRIQAVEGESMEKSFYDGDRIVSIYDNNIKRGDVVIARLTPLKENKNDEDEYLIKRVIGVPGDTIKYTKEGLYINGVYVKEEYTSIVPTSSNEYNKEFFIIKEDDEALEGKVLEYHSVIPKGYYFLMGDNRNNSLDSRKYGLFSQEEIVSVVILRAEGLKISFVKRGVLE